LTLSTNIHIFKKLKIKVIKQNKKGDKMVYLTTKISKCNNTYKVDENKEVYCSFCSQADCNCNCNELNERIRIANFWGRKARKIGIDHITFSGESFLRNQKRKKDNKKVMRIWSNLMQFQDVLERDYKLS